MTQGFVGVNVLARQRAQAHRVPSLYQQILYEIVSEYVARFVGLPSHACTIDMSAYLAVLSLRHKSVYDAISIPCIHAATLNTIKHIPALSMVPPLHRNILIASLVNELMTHHSR